MGTRKIKHVLGLSDGSLANYKGELDEFLISEGTKGVTRGRLNNFYADQDHEGWYIFIFENKSMFCTISSGLSLGFFVECGPDTVKLNPVLQEQLDESEKS